jgi:hypothetical protein
MNSSSPVAVIVSDALHATVGENPFDVVHERLLLINVPEENQKALIAQMLALLRPGGTIALQEWDRVSLVCYPAHPAWTTLLNAYAVAFSANGGNGATGRTLASLLRGQGVDHVEIKVHAKTVGVDEGRRLLLLSLLDSMHDKMLAIGQLKRGGACSEQGSALSPFAGSQQARH